MVEIPPRLKPTIFIYAVGLHGVVEKWWNRSQRDTGIYEKNKEIFHKSMSLFFFLAFFVGSPASDLLFVSCTALW